MKNTFVFVLTFLLTIAAVYGLTTFMKLDSFAFAWALNFLLMLSAVYMVEAAGPALTSSWYDQKVWERKGKLYERLGIHIFRKLLVWIGWEKLVRKTAPVDKRTGSLAHLYQQTKKSELGHTVLFIVVLGFNVYVAMEYGFLRSIWLLVLNILFHLYPVFLQRYNRPRLQRAMQLSMRR